MKKNIMTQSKRYYKDKMLLETLESWINEVQTHAAGINFANPKYVKYAANFYDALSSFTAIADSLLTGFMVNHKAPKEDYEIQQKLVTASTRSKKNLQQSFSFEAYDDQMPNNLDSKAQNIINMLHNAEMSLELYHSCIEKLGHINAILEYISEGIEKKYLQDEQQKTSKVSHKLKSDKIKKPEEEKEQKYFVQPKTKFQYVGPLAKQEVAEDVTETTTYYHQRPEALPEIKTLTLRKAQEKSQSEIIIKNIQDLSDFLTRMLEFDRNTLQQNPDIATNYQKNIKILQNLMAKMAAEYNRGADFGLSANRIASYQQNCKQQKTFAPKLLSDLPRLNEENLLKIWQHDFQSRTFSLRYWESDIAKMQLLSAQYQEWQLHPSPSNGTPGRYLLAKKINNPESAIVKNDIKKELKQNIKLNKLEQQYLKQTKQSIKSQMVQKDAIEKNIQDFAHLLEKISQDFIANDKANYYNQLNELARLNEEKMKDMELNTQLEQNLIPINNELNEKILVGIALEQKHYDHFGQEYQSSSDSD
jgi:hypothetical protein